MRVIDKAVIDEILTYPAAIPLMREAMIALSSGRVAQPLRQIVPLRAAALFGVMPGVAEATFGAKLISVMPGNFSRGRPSHQGVVALFDPVEGAPLAVLHAGAITAIRTAAASAAATDALARRDARVLALLGYGEQALCHARAIACVRPVSEIRVWGRRADRARALAARLSAELGLPSCAKGAARDAVAGSDIVCTVTAASEPVLAGVDVPTGAHVNIVGSGHAAAREVDDALLARGRLFADQREGALRQGGEILHAIAAGAIGEAQIIGEIGEVFAGAVAGRRSDSEVTLYKSLGAIAQDLAAGWFVFEEARRRGLGVEVDF